MKDQYRYALTVAHKDGRTDIHPLIYAVQISSVIGDAIQRLTISADANGEASVTITLKSEPSQ